MKSLGYRLLFLFYLPKTKKVKEKIFIFTNHIVRDKHHKKKGMKNLWFQRRNFIPVNMTEHLKKSL